MSGFRVGNPVLNENTFERRVEAVAGPPMTLNGTIQKSFLLLAITIAAGFIGWQMANTVVLIGAMLIGIGLAVGIAFKPNLAPVLSPVYAIVMGIFAGAVSFIADRVVAESEFTLGAGVVPTAIAGTFVVFGVMLTLYVTRIIKVTETFRSVVIGATAAVMIVYLGSFLLSFFWSGVYSMPIYGSGPIGIIFSVFVIGLAAFNLAVDFDLIEKGVQGQYPKHYEWFGAFALLVTLIWLYIEILRLLMKLARR